MDPGDVSIVKELALGRWSIRRCGNAGDRLAESFHGHENFQCRAACDLENGGGTVSLGSGAFSGRYAYKSRLEDGDGANPKELLGAARAACFSMALSRALAAALAACAVGPD